MHTWANTYTNKKTAHVHVNTYAHKHKKGRREGGGREEGGRERREGRREVGRKQSPRGIPLLRGAFLSLLLVGTASGASSCAL